MPETLKKVIHKKPGEKYYGAQRPQPIFEGDIFKNTRGTEFVVKDYYFSNKVIIKFLDEFGFERFTNVDGIKKGLVKNPYDKVHSGVGYLGEGIHNSSSPHYAKWAAMISRCYNKEIQSKRYPSYLGCSVDSIWHNFQNYCEWSSNNEFYNKGWHLDKDLIVLGNKVYSPETCCFIPPEINSCLINCLDEFSGVNFDKSRGLYLVRASLNKKVKNLGRFDSEQEALIVYRKYKQMHLNDLSEKYEGLVDKRVLKTLREIF